YSEIRASALSRFWRELLGLTAELALEPKLAPEEVDRERDFLLSRVQRRRDSAPSRAFDEFYALLYGRHPYGLPPLGTPASLRNFDHAAVVARSRAFYRPERMVLAVSGQVPVDDVLAEAQRLFGELRDKRALAYTATAFHEPMKEPGVLVLYLGTTPETAAQAEQALLAEIARVKREPVPTEELARAKSYLLGRYAMDRRTSE